MSIKLMSLIWSDHTGTLSQLEKAVLLRMADFAADDGSSIYPGFTKLSDDLNVSYRSIQRIIGSLVDKSALKKVKKENSYKHLAGEFRINVKFLEQLAENSQKRKKERYKKKPVDKLPPHDTVTGGAHDTVTGGAHDTVSTQPLLKTFINNPPTPKGKEREDLITKFLEDLRSIFPKDKQGGGDISACIDAIERHVDPKTVIADAEKYIKQEREQNEKGKYIKKLSNWLNSYALDKEENYRNEIINKFSSDEQYLYLSIQ